jgi:ATP-dependent Clp protease adapter protein ClpS
MEPLNQDPNKGQAPAPKNTFSNWLNNLLGRTPQPTNAPAPEQPAMWTVFLKNNPYTPYTTVLRVLQEAFDLDFHAAQALMFQVHRSGENAQASIGTWPLDTAQTKVALAKAIEREDLRMGEAARFNKPEALEFPIAQAAEGDNG